MSQAFFDRWFPGEPNHFPGFFAEVSRVIPATGRILDLGCGANYHLAFFRTPEREVWGADLQRHSQLMHAEWFRVIGADGALPFDDGSLDLVTTLMVAEHVADPPAFLREVARVLRPGGHFVVHTISALHYATWIHRTLGMLPRSWGQRLVRPAFGRKKFDIVRTCFRMNTPARIARLGRVCGLEPAHLQRYAGPGDSASFKWLDHGAVIADWMLDKIWPGLGRIYFTAIYRRQAAEQTGLAPAGASAAAA